jgi:hypothetical protein
MRGGGEGGKGREGRVLFIVFRSHIVGALAVGLVLRYVLHLGLHIGVAYDGGNGQLRHCNNIRTKMEDLPLCHLSFNYKY